MRTSPVQTDTPQLSTTSYAVLGLLTFGDHSGYDLMKLAERSIAYFWAPTKSHLYGELKRLSRLQYVAERHIEQKDRPDKRIYSITDSGRQALVDWMSNSEVAPEPVKSELTLRVFFGHLVDRATLLAQIKEMRRHAHKELDQMRAIERTIKDEPELFYPYLTLRAGLAIKRAKIRWADYVIDALLTREEP